MLFGRDTGEDYIALNYLHSRIMMLSGGLPEPESSIATGCARL